MNSPDLSQADSRATAATGTNISDDPDTIERNLDRTRERLDHTLDALQAKFSPGQMLDRGLDLLKRNGGELAANFGEQIKRNPMPLLLTGVGMAWLIGSGHSVPAGTAPVGSAQGHALGAAADRARGIGEDLGARASDAASSVREAASATAGRLAVAARAARVRGRQAGAGMSRLVQEQPLLIGILGLAAGALLGAMLPATEAEDRLMGGTRDQSLAQAKRNAAEVYSGARAAARDSVQRSPGEPGSQPGENVSARTH